MKTISIALVSAGLLALTACGGGTKSGNNLTATNSLDSVSDIGNTSALPPPPADLGPTNATLGSGNLSGSATLGNTTGNLSGGVTANTAANTTTK